MQESDNLAGCCSAPLKTIGYNQPMASAARMMSHHKVRHLPVTRDGAVIGIVSERDVLRAARTDLCLWGDAKIEDKDFDPAYFVQDFMSYPIASVDIGTSVGAIAEQMVEKRISSVVVTEDEVPIGIVTTDDLLKLMVKRFGRKPTFIHTIWAGWQQRVMDSPIRPLIDTLNVSGI